jgi:hypothetical protein
VPPRSEITLNIRVSNPEIITGYIPKLNACDGVYIGDAIVTDHERRVNLKVINTLEETLQLFIPTLKIQEIEQIKNLKNKTIKNNKKIKQKHSKINFTEVREETPEEIMETTRGLAEICWNQLLDDEDQQRKAQGLAPLKEKIIMNSKNKDVFEKPKEPTPKCSWDNNIYTIQESLNKPESKNARYMEIEKCLRMEHLNQEEKVHVKDLIKKHENLFKLPNEPLTPTNKIYHKINTTDDISINVKQYRFPPCIRRK